MPSPTSIASAILLGCAITPAAASEATSHLRAGDRIVCIGDSITASGCYEEFVHAALRALYPAAGIVVINRGVGGQKADAATGLLTASLANCAPTLALVMFGVNDTGWSPDDPQGKATNFAIALGNAADVAEQARLPLILLRETPFAHAMAPPADAFESVLNAVLDRLQDEQRAVAATRRLPLVDVRAAYERALARAWSSDPAYEFTPDVIHPNSAGHAAIAGAILHALGAGLPLAEADADRGAIHEEGVADVALSLADAVGIVADADGSIPLQVTLRNAGDDEATGTLVLAVAGLRLERAVRIAGHGAAEVALDLPIPALDGRATASPIYAAFIGAGRFASFCGLLSHATIRPAAAAPVSFSADDFQRPLDGAPPAADRPCPVSRLAVTRSGEEWRIDLTWDDAQITPARTGSTDRFGTVIPTPLNLKSREGQSADAVECFLDLRPLASIGRPTANIDANPPGILRIGIHAADESGRTIMRCQVEPEAMAGAVALTHEGGHDYRLMVKARPVAPCAGFSARVTDLPTSTGPWCLTGSHGLGQEQSGYVQLGDASGVFYRIGY